MKNISVVRVQMVKEKGFKYETNIIKSPEDAGEIARKFLEDYCQNDRENMILLCLDTKNKISNVSLIGTGTLNQALCHPREVFKTAILSNAASVIISHNHPSGDSTPSREDIQLTKRLMEAGEILGISVLDHIVLGDCTQTSLKSKGLI